MAIESADFPEPGVASVRPGPAPAEVIASDGQAGAVL
jgi:hypothetical protein